MSCCAPGAEMALDIAFAASASPSSDEIRLASRNLGGDIHQTELSVPAVHCGACIQTIETALAKIENVDSARVSLSTKRVTVRWHGSRVPPFFAVLGRLGYQAHLFDPETHEKDKALSELIRAV
ncbi:MAG: nitrogen fixation protein FixI, partial [Mesorhizobium sp.]|uniref:cation transporter n=1 Tax=Mesorhizobium sp. TaxID=1871066 RepID=UPI00122B6DA4